MSERNRPMPMAEFDECCGRRGRSVFANGESEEWAVCENCPVILEAKRQRLLREARAR